MLPVKDPPVTAVNEIALEVPRMTVTDVDAVFKVSVGNGDTVSVYVAVCVPVLSVPVTTMLFAPVAMVEGAVTVTVAVVPGRSDPGLMLPIKPAVAVAVKKTLFWPAPLSVTLSVNEAVFPARTVPWLAEGVSTKSIFGLVVLNLPPHSFTSTAASADPRPVARL